MAKTLDEAGVKRLIQEIKGANKNLNAPIPISTENTTESKAQNVKNIADYVEKAKAAGIADVNGMAVTCLIDDYYSGVGYLYGDTDTTICGIILTDDAIEGKFFSVQSTGEYYYNIIISSGDGSVNSGMLDQGARNPIILTPSTTEVDEETYQKLLSDDVDVVFKTSNGDANLCILTYKYDDGDVWSFTFTCFSREGEFLSDTFFYGYEVRITKNGNPHPCEVIDNSIKNQFSQILLNEGFTNQSFLSPVLQEIDLTGTDADRKAKLDQFETDWKALTGAGDLSGARFVGYVDAEAGLEKSVIFSYNIANDYWSGVNSSSDGITSVTINPDNGFITITPLFSHLEAITIKTGNTPEAKAANVAAIKAYVDNLISLGVDVTKGYMIPIRTSSLENIVGFIIPNMKDTGYVGLGKFSDSHGISLYITNDGTFYEFALQNQRDNNLTTTSKYIIPSINEVNALAKEKADKSLNAKSLEAITIGDNTPEGKAATKAVIEAYRDNLTALGVDVTKGFMIPIKTNYGNGFIFFDGTKGDGYVKVNNDCYGISITANYAFDVNNLMSTLTTYSNLNTTSKRVLPAINEVNDLAKGYSTLLAPIELTTETAQNKTAIDARVAAFTAQGISLTNGCCIPVTYKGVYAGNISLINGDWYGLLVKNTNNPADNINIKLSADGTITEGNSAQ